MQTLWSTFPVFRTTCKAFQDYLVSKRLEPALFRLENPHAFFWGRRTPRIKRVLGFSNISRRKKLLLFVHGMEYYGVGEVVSDLLVPFEKQAELFRSPDSEENFDFLFVFWSSTLIDESDEHALLRVKRRLGLTAFSILVWRYWRQIFKDLESRADQAGLFMASFCDYLDQKNISQNLYTISHSLGARVWARALCVSSEARGDLYPGYWLNLQPALEHDAFWGGRPFTRIQNLYSKSKARHAVWFSKFDFILSTLFLLVKRRPAMGHIGCVAESFSSLNVTVDVREAHGKVSLFSRKRCFFTRAGRHIRNEATRYILPATNRKETIWTAG